MINLDLHVSLGGRVLFCGCFQPISLEFSWPIGNYSGFLWQEFQEQREGKEGEKKEKEEEHSSRRIRSRTTQKSKIISAE